MQFVESYSIPQGEADVASSNITNMALEEWS